MRAIRIPVRLTRGSYVIHVASQVDDTLAKSLAKYRRRLVVVTDPNVRRKVWPRVKQQFQATGLLTGEPIVIQAGEIHKNLKSFGNLHQALLERGVDRQCMLVALGGGTVTDLTGFVAATYMRGIDWLAVPTTLLGMVDAAIGGKTGINHGLIKNSVGAFHQPRVVWLSADFLSTLPAREKRSGYGEIIKYAMIADRRLFRELELNPPRKMNWDPVASARMIARCCRIKAQIVSADEKEMGFRAALNFGHTIGHALEGAGRSGLMHGEAVGLGMLAACQIAEDLGIAKEPLRVRLRQLLRGYGLPVRPARIPTLRRLEKAWSRDKKSIQGRPRFILTPRIGHVEIGYEINSEQLGQALRQAWD